MAPARLNPALRDRVSDLPWLFCLALVVLGPVWFAGEETRTYALLSMGFGVCLLLWAVLWPALGRPAEPVLGRLWPGLAAFGLALCWAWFQTLPVAPDAWRHPLWAVTAEGLGVQADGAISLVPALGRQGVLRLLGYLAVFWLFLQYGRKPERARQGIRVLAVAAALYALWGLGVHLAGIKKVLWYSKTAYVNDLTGTFINRNSFAAFLGLGLLCLLGLSIRRWISAADRLPPGTDSLAAVLENLKPQGWLMLIGVVLVATALLLTHSRAGVASAGLGVLALLTCLRVNGVIGAAAFWRILLTVAVAGVLILLVAGAGLKARLELSGIDIEMDQRPQLYALSFQAIGDSPWLGNGLGSFPSVYKLYRTADIRQLQHSAHSTWLENAVELGIPAAILLALGVAWPVFLCMRGLVTRRRHRLYPALAVAAALMLAAHSTIDFSLEVPGINWWFAAILGLGTAQSWSSRGGGTQVGARYLKARETGDQ